MKRPDGRQVEEEPGMVVGWPAARRTIAIEAETVEAVARLLLAESNILMMDGSLRVDEAEVGGDGVVVVCVGEVALTHSPRTVGRSEDELVVLRTRRVRRLGPRGLGLETYPTRSSCATSVLCGEMCLEMCLYAGVGRDVG